MVSQFLIKNNHTYMATLKNKPAKGMKLHKFIALGGKPKDYNSVNGTEKLRSSSKKKGK